SAAYTFTATLSDASQGVTTVHTDQGDITIANGQTVGTLVVGSNGEDDYLDASSLTATISSTSRGNFENLVVAGGGSATAHINDTITDATVTFTPTRRSADLSAAYTFTATLSDASQGVTTVHTDQGDITIANGQTVGTLVVGS